MESKHRTVNRSLGKQPNIGPFPANQILPILGILCFSYVVRAMFRLDWLMTALLAGWLMGSSWTLIGSRPWRYFGRFVNPPRFARGGVQYRSLLDPRRRHEDENG